MKVLWLKTIELLRRYPVLWLPVVWAGALGYGWALLRMIVRSELTAHLAPREMFFGVPYPQAPAHPVEFYFLAGLNQIGLSSVEVCCYFAALLMTAKMVGRLTTPSGEAAPYADVSIRTRGARLVRVGLVTSVFGWSCLELLMVAVVHVAQPESWGYWIVPGQLVAFTVIAYFVAPAVLRLLSRWPGEALEPEVLGIGRVGLMLAGVGITSVALVLRMVPAIPDPGVLGSKLLSVVWSILSALPFAPLFVALSLVMLEEPNARELGDPAVQESEPGLNGSGG